MLKVAHLLAAEDAADLSESLDRVGGAAGVKEIVARVLDDLAKEGIVLVAEHVDPRHRKRGVVEGLKVDPDLRGPISRIRRLDRGTAGRSC
jgi:hypothetical protein